MDFLLLIIYALIVYAIIRNILLSFLAILSISILLGAVQWFVIVFYENKINAWLRTLPDILGSLGTFVYLFMPLIIAIVIRKYFAYQKNKRTEISNKSSEQTKT